MSPPDFTVHEVIGKRLLLIDQQVENYEKIVERMAKNTCGQIEFDSASPDHNMNDLLKTIYEFRGGLQVVPQSENLTITSEENPDNWHVTKIQFDGTFQGDFQKEDVKGQKLVDGMGTFNKNPMQYMGIVFKEGEPNYTLIPRSPVTKLIPNGVSPDGEFTLATGTYSPLPPFKKDKLPKKTRDEYTDLMTYNGNKVKTLMPGRGMGLLDQPNLKFMGGINPCDIRQGLVDDCGLLAAISTLAAYERGIRNLFRKTTDNNEITIRDTPNYVVTLYDISSWKEVGIIIDERLCVRPNFQNYQGENMLLGAKPSTDGELWVPYLEKAVAIHCGGWDKIHHCTCNHAWAMLTGVKEQCLIVRTGDENSKWSCKANYDPSKKKFADFHNDPSEGYQNLFCTVPWPDTTGGTFADFKDLKEKKDEDLFDLMCKWDDENFLMACSRKKKDTTDGTTRTRTHTYCVAYCQKNLLETEKDKIDMIQLRNPLGREGELEEGEFARENSPGWTKHPQLKTKLRPDLDAPGLFWLTKEEFFKYYHCIFLSARNMRQVLGPRRDKVKVNGSDNSIPDNVKDTKKQSKNKSVKVKAKRWKSIGIVMNYANPMFSFEYLPGTLERLTNHIRDGEKVVHLLWCKTPKVYPELSLSQKKTAAQMGFSVVTTSIEGQLYHNAMHNDVSRLYLKECKGNDGKQLKGDTKEKKLKGDKKEKKKK